MLLALTRFNPLWINTALKLVFVMILLTIRFNPLWINTALKQSAHTTFTLHSFNPLWINTALKRLDNIKCYADVSIPYGLTLLSNVWLLRSVPVSFQSPMD